MTFQSIIDDYAVWHEISGHSPKTIKWYRWVLTTFEQWLLRNGRSTQVNAMTIADARAFLKAEAERTELYGGTSLRPTTQKALSDRTLHGYARALRAFFRWAVEENYLNHNPMERLKPPKLEKRHKQILSVEDVERLFAEVNTRTFLGARMYAMLALFYDSGLRLSEVVGLDLQDIDWDAFQFRVRGKGKKERRVPFGAATHRALRKYVVLRQQFAVDGEDAVFISTRGSRLDDDATYHLIKRLGERAGIPRLHPHLLRHSAAVAYIINGGSAFELKRILGHEQLSTTDIYLEMAGTQLSEQHKKFSPMSKVNERRAQIPALRRRRK